MQSQMIFIAKFSRKKAQQCLQNQKLSNNFALAIPKGSCKDGGIAQLVRASDS